MRVGLRRVAGITVAGLALLAVGSCASPLPPPQKSGPNYCDANPSGFVEINLKRNEANECVAQYDSRYETVCVERGNLVRWKVANVDCDLKPGTAAFELTQPRLRGDEKITFTFERCTPRLDAFERGVSMLLDCQVPKAATPGTYKYGLQGQIKPVDPGLDIRRDS